MGFIDDLLDFNIDETETVDDVKENSKSLPPRPMTDCEEYEELEWLSNKDVFPSVDTFIDISPSDPSTIVLKHQSPVSVLDNSNISFGSNNSITSYCSGRSLTPPIRRPRSKGFKRKQRSGFVNIPSHHWFELSKNILAKKKTNFSGGVIGRKCTHCGSEKTPQWRAGPDGPKTLCNACGVRFKSGRLCPEYRPANSPTFSSAVHSNSHRKIVEMRKMSNTKVNPVDNG